jgi:hypothetical protein
MLNYSLPIAQLKPNFDGIVIGRSSSKIVSGSCALRQLRSPAKMAATVQLRCY